MQNKRKNKFHPIKLDGDGTIPFMKLLIWKNGKITLNPFWFTQEEIDKFEKMES